MAMKPYKRAVAVTGTYEDRQGNEKKRYQNVGTLFEYDDGGFVLKLEALPISNEWSGFINFYDIEEREGTRGGARQQGSQPARQSSQRETFAADLDDEIPF